MEGSVLALTLFAIIIGIALGLVTARFIFRDGDGVQVKIIQNQFDDYQREVVEYMDTTLELFKKLNHNYQEIDQHLSAGAERLTLDAETRDRLISSINNSKGISHDNEPPKDYAPKAAGQTGDLSRI